MALTHDPSNINGIIDWTDEINDIDNLFGFIRSQSIFNLKTTASTSIVFDKIVNEIRLIPATNRNANERNVGKDRTIEQFAMALQYYSDDDYITVQDIQDQRMPGNADTEETFANVRAIKLEDLKMSHDQTDEFLRYTAMIGDLPAGAAAGSADMYALFGLNKAADFTVDLDAGNVAVDLDGKIADVKRRVANGIKAGTAISGVDFWLTEELFDQIIANPKYREVYLNYNNNVLVGENMDFFSWGVTSFFEYRGVRFLAYNPTFTDNTGSSVTVMTGLQGFATPRGARDLYRGYWGPAARLQQANRGGQELFSVEFTTPGDKGHTLEMESTKIYLTTKPAAIIQLTST